MNRIFLGSRSASTNVVTVALGGNGRNTLFLLKLCPKCGGDLTGEADHWGRYLRCFQCGFNRDEEVIVNAAAHKWTKPDSYGRRSTRKA